MTTKRRLPALLAAALSLSLALAPAIAEARAGKGFSMGSRGARTYAPTPAKPMERSIAPQPGPQQAIPQARAATPQTPRGGIFQRNPFLGGLVGGLLGAGLFALLLGNFGNIFGAGFAGFLGFLLQMALIGGAVWLALSLFRRRAAERPAYAGPSGLARNPHEPERAYQPAGSPGRGPGPLEIPIVQADLDTFQRMLDDIQDAWSRGDTAALRRLMTEEMAGYMEEQLAEDRARGVENRIEQVKLLKGDLNESWLEGDTQYATVTMRWTALDYDVRPDTGEVVSGNIHVPTEATEVWTLLRRPGEPWLLSAIQQM